MPWKASKSRFCWAVLHRLRREGTIDDLVVRRIEDHLDIDELRLRGVDPLE